MEKANNLAAENCRRYGPHMHTVLFLDEANTTEAVGTIKEILCDHSLGGVPIQQLHTSGLRLVAACNPYRKWVIHIVYCNKVYIIHFTYTI